MENTYKRYIINCISNSANSGPFTETILNTGLQQLLCWECIVILVPKNVVFYTSLALRNFSLQ